MKYSTRQAFTLIELLTVIAVVSVLALFLIPAINSVRKKADASKCVANMHQIGMAALAYSNDNDNFLPGPVWAEQGLVYRVRENQVVHEGHLISYLAEYLTQIPEQNGSYNIQSFICPAWASAKGFAEGSFISRGVPYQGEQRYLGINRAEGLDGTTSPKSRSEIPNPSAIAMLFESDMLDGTYYGNTGNDRLATQPVHNDHRNYLFFDGSVRPIFLSEQSRQQQRQRMQ